MNGQSASNNRAAQILRQFHESVIEQGRINATVEQSIRILGIPLVAVLRLDRYALLLTREDAVKRLLAIEKSAQLGDLQLMQHTIH